MAWFKRKEKELQLRLKTKWMFKGLWYKSPTGKIIDAELNALCESRRWFSC
jgi:hypothetical protein